MNKDSNIPIVKTASKEEFNKYLINPPVKQILNQDIRAAATIISVVEDNINTARKHKGEGESNLYKILNTAPSGESQLYANCFGWTKRWTYN